MLGNRVVESRNKGETRGLLFVVAQDRLGLYDYLAQHFSGEEEVRIILDRRRKERRQAVQLHEPERRRKERRQQNAIDNYLRSLGYLIAR